MTPIELRPKEGLALINGTQLMRAFAARDALRARRLLKTSMAAASLSLEAFQATDRVFDPRIHALKPHPGQARVAAASAAWKRAKSSRRTGIATACRTRIRSDASRRCSAPSTTRSHGSSRWIVREINAVTDNPIVFPDDGDVISGGNFHGQHMAIALDALAIAACEIASIAERRVDQLMGGDGERVPRCLIRDPGLNSGFMIAQYLAAAHGEREQGARASRVGGHHPHLDGFRGPREHGEHSALKLARVLDNVARVVAVELLCGAQALDFHRPLAPGRGTKVAHAAVRAAVPFIERDTSLTPHLAALEARVNDRRHRGRGGKGDRAPASRARR